jgi:sialate O-acetylesterase
MKISCSVLFLLVFFHIPSNAQIKLPRLVRDSMILQRDTKLKIWGWASKGEEVKIKFNGKSAKAKAGSDGKWIASLSAMKAGGPYTMEINGKNEGKNKITLKDVLIGDVWFCSGQSNMVHQMGIHNVTYAKDIAEANNPQIRHFWIPTLTSLSGPKDDLPIGYWKWANPKDINDFSAIAYFFAKKIYDKYHVPIGLINASVGGTPIEAWTSEEGFKDFPSILTTIQRNKDTAFVNNANHSGANRVGGRRQETDKGLIGAIKWFDPVYVPKGWQTINIPGYWEDQGIKDLNGVVWYRREIDIPQTMTGVPAKVFLGRIVDADALYINGAQVGNTTYQYPQRRYNIPAGILKPGKNLFVVRVTNTSGKGGFVPDKPYSVEAAGQSVDLKGYWLYKVGEVYAPARGGGGVGGISAQNSPTALYNAMVAPAINYSIKGILWYQGETNAGNAQQYQKLFPALIADWRNKWGQGNIPFLFVQLPNYMEANYLPSESSWAGMREAALKTLSVPNTAMAVTIELGEWNDIHPDNKKDVGERLALGAMKIAYGENIVASGPLYQSAKIDGNKITISFTDIGNGLTTNDGEEPNYFAIAGPDKRFVWAKAKIEGDRVVVWSDEITEPKFVRYAWADNPFGANLYNKEGLPASPFRTDE